MRPHVGAVERDIDGNVSDDLDAEPVGVGFERPPLLEELELAELPEVDFLRELPRAAREGLRLPHADVLRPPEPLVPAEVHLDRHIEAVVLQPDGVFRAERPVGGGIRVAAAPEGGVQHGEAVPVDPGVVDRGGVVPPAAGGDLRPGQQPLPLEQVEVDEIGVAREGGKALVGAVAIAGRPERQHLPVALAGVAQKVDERVGRAAEGADPVWGGQARHRQQDARAAAHGLLFSDVQSFRLRLVDCFRPVRASGRSPPR